MLRVSALVHGILRCFMLLILVFSLFFHASSSRTSQTASAPRHIKLTTNWLTGNGMCFDLYILDENVQPERIARTVKVGKLWHKDCTVEDLECEIHASSFTCYPPKDSVAKIFQSRDGTKTYLGRGGGAQSTELQAKEGSKRPCCKSSKP
eukprot:TRINITY_DN33951_c0_g1_i1.p1 TRINITY_DN33951_c0_g1~~TRINITY_DN33951_c0_g1_i1.p1  ORF type:complete len:150 (-),score=15.85 TRINITY_DN33951_c0_g1_i1:130-579(-)